MKFHNLLSQLSCANRYTTLSCVHPVDKPQLDCRSQQVLQVGNTFIAISYIFRKRIMQALNFNYTAFLSIRALVESVSKLQDWEYLI